MFVSVILLSLPSVAFAAGLVPCGGPGEPECQACYLIQLGNNIIDLLVGIAAVIGAIMFAVAGLKMATSGGNESAVSAAKQSMTNVVIGFVILLAAWLIVDTVMKTFVDQSKFEKAGFGVWNQIQCVDLPMFAREGTAPGGVYDPIGLGGVPSGELDGADAQSQLSVAGVNVISSGRDGNGNYCYDANNSNCTSLTGMRSNTVNQVVNIKTACPSCTVTVTGGTEAGP